MEEPQKNPELPLPPEVADLNTESILEDGGLTPLEKKDLANQEVGRSTPEYGEIPSSFEDDQPGWADIWGDDDEEAEW